MPDHDALEQMIHAIATDWSRERDQALADTHLHAELRATSPLSVITSEKIDRLRAWARERSVPAD
jgi:hypothetical protein